MNRGTVVSIGDFSGFGSLEGLGNGVVSGEIGFERSFGAGGFLGLGGLPASEFVEGFLAVESEGEAALFLGGEETRELGGRAGFLGWEEPADGIEPGTEGEPGGAAGTGWSF